jgi:hypothetical protein
MLAISDACDLNGQPSTACVKMGVELKMRVIDIDPKLLDAYATASIHSSTEAWTHMEAEYAGNIDGLMETLVPEGPYAYTIVPQVHADGSVKSPIISTFDEIRECYKFVRGRSDMVSAEPLIELNGGWYNFQENISRGRPKGGDIINDNAVIGLFPVSTSKGITGELVWVKTPRSKLGTGPDPVEPPLEGVAGRRQLLKLHNQYLAALRANDVEAILDTMNDGVQANIRDYVNDTGTLIPIQSKGDYRDYLTAFFEKFEVRAANFLHRVMEDWYLFAEVRVSMLERKSGRPVAINTVDFFIPAKDNRFIVQTGHGTDLT